MPGLPLPFLCDWETENNDDANWEPGGTLFNGLSEEDGPPGGLFEVYAIARLNSPTKTATTSLMAPMVDGRTDDVIVAILDFQYFLRGKPEDCRLSVKVLRKDGARIQIWSTEDHFVEGDWQDSGRLQFNPPVPFQLVFESTLSPGINASYVAVNDVKFSTGVLLSQYTCEGGSIFPGSCGLIDLDGRWSYWTGLNASDNNKGPLADHTLDSQSGHFIINRNTIWYEQFTRLRAHLQTPDYYKWTDQSSCTFRFYYHAKNAPLGDMEIAVSADSGSRNYTINLDDSERWVEHTIDLTNVSGNYRVTFDVLTASANNHIAIDDIGFLEDECKGRRFCQSFPCMNGGTCVQSSSNDFHCTCAEGYEGADCSINIDECSLDSTLCADDDTRICQNASPGYQCVCRANLMEYKGRCIASCLDNPCSREFEVCLQNDNGFTCQCQYGYIDSEDGQCIRDKTDVKHGMTPYEKSVILGSYLGGIFLAILTGLLVVTCYFSCCDEAAEDDQEPDQTESENYYEELGVSELTVNGRAPGMSVQNGGFEMEDRNSIKK